MSIGEHHRALLDRATRVIPGGMYGHMSVQRMMPEGYPQFFTHAHGNRLTDVDGNTYIDYMCAFGPMILGYGHPRVAAAAAAQREQIDTATGPAPVMVELAERFVGQISHADWALFGKNGNDATTACLMMARARTSNTKVLLAKGAYHGSQPWATPIRGGVTASDRADFVYYEYNDIVSLEKAAAEAGDDLAGIVVSAFKHDAFVDQAMPDPAFARRARELCDAADAVLILDEVRAGFRLSLDASWSTQVGVQPDLSAWGKCIANGEPISAVLGNDRVREAASEIYVTGSFWYQAAPMAAALATLDELVALDAPRTMEVLGQTLRDGLCEQAERHGHAIRQTGPVQMPLIQFEDDPKLAKGFAFCSELIKRGIYFHAWHNMFLSTAHTMADIEQTLEATDLAFRELAVS